MNNVVLDASALLALVNQEPGQEVVANLLPRSVISAVNFSELVAKLTEQGIPEKEVQNILGFWPALLTEVAGQNALAGAEQQGQQKP